MALGVNDACVVYFAGHGYYDESLGEGYWIPADARKTDGQRLAKEDWLWNSTITKIISASSARHILVIADSCYGGSLFRGEGETPPRYDLHWYGRAISKPSRYLIASGDVEPVLDSGGRHSIFARELLNYLNFAERQMFSASDLGIALREKVSSLTPQMVQMGPLAVSGHAGGEFVFVRRGAVEEFTAALRPLSIEQGVAMRGASPPPPAAPAEAAAARQSAFRSALELSQAGATNAASRLLAAVADPADRLAQAVAAYLDQEQKTRRQAAARELIERLAARSATAQKPTLPPDAARPRLLACLGPELAPGTAQDQAAQALLYRLCLRAEIEALGRVQTVEREALQQVLEEMQVGASDLADARVRTEIGRLLPAGMLLLGDLFPGPQGERVFLRLVDTETGRILATARAERSAAEDVGAVCRALAAEIVAQALKAKPLAARVTAVQAERLEAGVGRFQGATTETPFSIVQRAEGGDRVVGRARIGALGEIASVFVPQWNAGVEPAQLAELWIRESAE